MAEAEPPKIRLSSAVRSAAEDAFFPVRLAYVCAASLIVSNVVSALGYCVGLWADIAPYVSRSAENLVARAEASRPYSAVALAEDLTLAVAAWLWITPLARRGPQADQGQRPWGWLGPSLVRGATAVAVLLDTAWSAFYPYGDPIRRPWIQIAFAGRATQFAIALTQWWIWRRLRPMASRGERGRLAGWCILISRCYLCFGALTAIISLMDSWVAISIRSHPALLGSQLEYVLYGIGMPIGLGYLALNAIAAAAVVLLLLPATRPEASRLANAAL